VDEDYGTDWLPSNKFLIELQDTAIVLYTLAQAKVPITKRIIESLDDIFVIEMSYPIPEMVLSFEERMSLVTNVAKDIEVIATELLSDELLKSEKSIGYDAKIELYQKITSNAYNRVIPLYRELMAILAPERNASFENRKIEPINVVEFLNNLRHEANATSEEFKISLKEDHNLRVLLKRYGIDPDIAITYL
jgi:hypothetical protein